MAEWGLPVAMLSVLLSFPIRGGCVEPTQDERLATYLSSTIISHTDAGCMYQLSPIPIAPTEWEKVTVTWSGACVNEAISGPGLLQGVHEGVSLFSYEGGTLDGKLEGDGSYHAKNLDLKGPFRSGGLNGDHTVIAVGDVFLYLGAAKDNTPDGYGVGTFRSKLRYEGEWHRGLKEGHGVQTWPDGSRYDGDWRADRATGTGKTITKPGDTYEGGFLDGRRQGRGTYTSAAGSRLEGQWVNGAMEGLGSALGANGIHYDGEFRAGEITGKGRMVLPNGMSLDGEWIDSIPNGVGTLIRPGQSPLTSMWVNGCSSDENGPIAFGYGVTDCPHPQR